MDILLAVISDILLAAGGLFVIAGTIGILRFPDFFTRMHAAGITDTAGIGLIVAGLALQASWGAPLVKLFLTLMFLLITSPTSSHALAKAAIHGGLSPTSANTETKPSK